MSDEIKVQIQVTCRNGNLRYSFAPGQKSINQAAVGGPTPGYVTIGTTEETVTFGELGTAGWLMMQNLDPTNYVQWGPATGVYVGRMEAGEPAAFRIEPGTTLYMKANTAACKVLVECLED